MAKNYTNAQAQETIRKHQSVITSLQNIVGWGSGLKNEVKKASEKMITDEILRVLREVPVEALSREQGGIKTKLLREAGITTVSDVLAAGANRISNIKGISPDGASAIKKIALQYKEETKKQTKIQLSSDNRTENATELIRSIALFLLSEPVVKEASALLGANKARIEGEVLNLQPALSSFKFMFASKEIKNKAGEAYDTLSELLGGEYGSRAKAVIKKANGISAISDEEAWQEFVNNSIAFINALEQINPGVLGNDDKMYGLPEDLAKEIETVEVKSAGLKCTLRNYQEWGVKYILHQGNVLLGDEMGLGKTIEAIATMVSLQNTGDTHFLVVCPASVITNWCREIEKQSTLKAIKIHGDDKKQALALWCAKGGVGVTTYETTGMFELEENFGISLLVVDEAHYIKNPNAQRSKNVREIAGHAHRLLFMTGTALENRVDEMISLITVLRPEMVKNIENIAFMATAPKFREQVASIYYRRKRDDVLAELPELIESREWCNMSREEKKKYRESVLAKDYTNIRRVSWNMEDLSSSCKANRLLEIVESAKEEGRKVIVFSFYLDTIKAVMTLLGEACVGPINGSVSPKNRQAIIDEFDKAPAGTVLVSQILSGGTGLNIQSASVVVICEPQFKPSIENQAISRAYRMGQTRNVLVYRLLCDDTVDERVMEMLENKQEIFDKFADKSVSGDDSMEAMKAAEIDDVTYGRIIEEEIERIKAEKELT